MFCFCSVMAETRIHLIERLTNGDQTLRYFIRPGSRSRPYRWFELWEIPEFVGRTARFEMERIKGGWKVIRQIDPAQ